MSLIAIEKATGSALRQQLFPLLPNRIVLLRRSNISPNGPGGQDFFQAEQYVPDSKMHKTLKAIYSAGPHKNGCCNICDNAGPVANTG